jgi:2-polyprenyl-3-methyl-5-hydroxy-6-metoxy-1,4-benzoquinol methylase
VTSTLTSEHAAEVRAGRRFEFGANWARFLSTLNDERIAEAERSLQRWLGSERLDGITFLDIGSGSGLFSLAARRLGAIVTSFDYDPQSLACTEELRARFFAGDPAWTTMPGSVLSPEFMASLGTFDVVYSWGVLHHTGQMWPALEQAQQRVRPGGRFFIALYNDQGKLSGFWKAVKRVYCSGTIGRWLVTGTFIPLFAAINLAADVKNGRHPAAVYRAYIQKRGMSMIHDWVDWLGGYPFEVAGAGEVHQYLHARGFAMQRLFTTPSLGCNEFLFVRTDGA